MKNTPEARSWMLIARASIAYRKTNLQWRDEPPWEPMPPNQLQATMNNAIKTAVEQRLTASVLWDHEKKI